MFKLGDIKYIIWDLDNTLVKCSPLVSPYFIWLMCETFKKYGSPIKVIQGLHRAKKIMYSAHESGDNYYKIINNFALGSGLDFSQCLEQFEYSMPRILGSLKPFFKPIGAAKSLVEKLESQIIFILATNSLWPEYFAKLRLQWALLDPRRFAFITHAHNMKYCKPQVEYYQEIINKQEIIRDTCLYIGDNYIKDAPATKAGLTTVILSKREGLRLIKPAGLSCAALYEGNYKSIGGLFGIEI